MIVLATHSIRQFPLHFPSRASPCATRFRKSSTHNNPFSRLLLAHPSYQHFPSRAVVNDFRTCCLPATFPLNPFLLKKSDGILADRSIMVSHSDKKDDGMIRLTKLTLQALEYIHSRRTKSPALMVASKDCRNM